MTTPSSSLRAVASGGQRFPYTQSHRRPSPAVKPPRPVRPASSAAAQRTSQAAHAARYGTTTDPSEKPHAKRKQDDKTAQRDFFLSVLGSSTTKREAKSYLQRFTLPRDGTKKSTSARTETTGETHNGCGVNVGNLYRSTAAAKQPRRAPSPDQAQASLETPLHVALVKIRAPQLIDDGTLEGVGRTLRQLERLGLTSIVVVETSTPADREDAREWQRVAEQQANRIVAAIDDQGRPGARKVEGSILVKEPDHVASSSVAAGPRHQLHRQLLTKPMRRGVIPVLPCIGYSSVSQHKVQLSGNDVVAAINWELSGLQPRHAIDDDPQTLTEQLQALRHEVSVDRLIILDPLGGIPSATRPNGYHIFLNLEQEYADVRRYLDGRSHRAEALDAPPSTRKVTDLAASNPFSQFAETEFGGPAPATEALHDDEAANSAIHRYNLDLVRQVLSVLPPSSSALLTTPMEAAHRKRDASVDTVGVGTRRRSNPLIHNLLTDKPAFSSSLPARRLGSEQPGQRGAASHTSQSTFAKKGLSLTVFPDPRLEPWQPPVPGQPRLTLKDSRIDLTRLVRLIDDSFGRQLDVEHYLDRVNDRIAGVIIAGEYEGGALLTWELPPGVIDDGSDEVRARMVPYLDKFAVLKRSQGAGGVADIVFSAMVRECFPDGVCWRSRRDNPVNKWYFERSRGTWKLPDSNWAMFWTTPELSLNTQTFRDYEAVCRAIQPSWADKKAVVD